MRSEEVGYAQGEAPIRALLADIGGGFPNRWPLIGRCWKGNLPGGRVYKYHGGFCGNALL